MSLAIKLKKNSSALLVCTDILGYLMTCKFRGACEGWHRDQIADRGPELLGAVSEERACVQVGWLLLAGAFDRRPRQFHFTRL